GVPTCDRGVSTVRNSGRPYRCGIFDSLSQHDARDHLYTHCVGRPLCGSSAPWTGGGIAGPILELFRGKHPVGDVAALQHEPARKSVALAIPGQCLGSTRKRRLVDARSNDQLGVWACLCGGAGVGPFGTVGCTGWFHYRLGGHCRGRGFKPPLDEGSAMARPHILFITGKLAEPSLRRMLAELAPRAEFDYTIEVLPITVVALATTAWIARHLAPRSAIDRVLLPGLCPGDPAIVAERLSVSVDRGPKDLRELPEFFG